MTPFPSPSCCVAATYFGSICIGHRFKFAEYTVGLRVSKEVEDMGMVRADGGNNYVTHVAGLLETIWTVFCSQLKKQKRTNNKHGKHFLRGCNKL